MERNHDGGPGMIRHHARRLERLFTGGTTAPPESGAAPATFLEGPRRAGFWMLVAVRRGRRDGLPSLAVVPRLAAS